MEGVDIRVMPFDHPDSLKLIEGVQQEYVVRYGDPDFTPVDPTEFAPPHGLFLLGYADDVPVASGGWRVHSGDHGTELALRDAELKRMFVVEHARGNGYARAILAELERTARAHGKLRTVLETGLKQPEAIALYRSSGYTEIPKFGVYRDEPLSVCMGKEL